MSDAVLTVICIASIAAIIVAVVLGYQRAQQPDAYGITILHHPPHGYRYQYRHKGGLISDGFYPTSTAAKVAGETMQKQTQGANQ